MSLGITAVIIVVLLLVLLFAGVRVFVALGAIGLLGMAFFLPGTKAAQSMMGTLAWSASNSFPLTPVPLFILMGELLVYGKMNEALYGTFSMWLGNIRGGLCHATTVSCALFAAMSGSSLATCATLGTIASPEMVERGYSRRLTYGTIVAGGTLGILIPPSITMIIYGNLAGVSIGHCFIAGIVPGLMCAASFIMLVTLWTQVAPGSASKAPPVSMRTRLLSLFRLMPVILIVFVVLGGIYLGITTPTEAGAIGAFAALILCLIQQRRAFSWHAIRKVLLSTVQTTCFIMVIVVCASMVSYVIQYIGVPKQLTIAVTQAGIPRYGVMALFYLMYLILGMLVDPVSMMVMTVPTILPAVIALGFDPIWFAVAITLTCEMGLITPPVGLNLYILQGITKRPLGEIAIGAAPFVVVLLIDLAILTAFPNLSLWLPNLM